MINFKLAFISILVISGIVTSFCVTYNVGYLRGYDKSELSHSQNENKALRSVIDDNIKVQGLIEDMHNDYLKLYKLKEKEKEVVIREVIKYAQNPNSRSESIDSEWLHIYNSSIKDGTSSGDSKRSVDTP